MTKTRSQRYSTDALTLVRKLKEREPQNSAHVGEGLRWLEKLPGLVLVNGLIGTLLKLVSESKDDEVAKMLAADLLAHHYEATKLVDMTSSKYMRAQRQCLEYLSWVKRWGQASLDKPKKRTGTPE